jgi:NAD(P)H-flavin reductase
MDLEASLAAGSADPGAALRPDVAARIRAVRARWAAPRPLPPSLAAILHEDPGDSQGSDLRMVRSFLRLLEEWCGLRLLDPARKCDVAGWVSFRFPEPLDFDHLVRTRPVGEATGEPFMEAPAGHRRRRDGFQLTDPRMSLQEVLGEVHYCVYCHERDKDSCSKGIRKDGQFRSNPLGVPLKGCPLGEKISEMHLLLREGDPLASLALVMIDNPMCPGTGHRICNDCMKGCIYQTQDPVNIPQIETRVLTEILGLPWGVEIYGLLTRWNPLSVRRLSALPYNGKNVLVVGLGPAGYTLSHHLLNEGFGVVAVDGLKIEPLPEEWIGGEGKPPRPVRSFAEISSALDRRILAGFGGVSEYGITVRWDKNFLTLLHLTLLRRAKFRAYGGVRFGGTLTLEDAWERGFHHVAIAAGTTPNITYEKEHPGTFQKDPQGKFFQPHRAVRNAAGTFSLERVETDSGPGFFTSYHQEGRFVTYYGDNHPVYAGSVVKAMASARDGFPGVVDLFRDELDRLDPAGQPGREESFRRLAERLDGELLSSVHRVERLTPSIVEVVVKAPLSARKFHPGQFYRLQSFESRGPILDGTRLTMEGIALTGAWMDPASGLLSLIVLEMGSSSRLCAALRPGDPVVIMGPTGTPTEIPREEAVLLAGGGLGNAVLFSIARALRDNGCRVIYFAGYKKGEDLFKREEIEEATDQVIWSTDAGAPIEPRRPQDRHFRGNIVQATVHYGDGNLGECRVPLGDVTRIIAIGSDRMMAAVKDARKTVLARFLNKDHVAIGSINSTMQCMLKEICAQCLQKQVDPVTGEETKPVFSCYNQDQPLDQVDFGNLAARLKMNTVAEKLSGLWLDHLFRRADLRRI